MVAVPAADASRSLLHALLRSGCGEAMEMLPELDPADVTWTIGTSPPSQVPVTALLCQSLSWGGGGTTVGESALGSGELIPCSPACARVCGAAPQPGTPSGWGSVPPPQHGGALALPGTGRVLGAL